MKNDDPLALKLGWSGFARDRYVPEGPHVRFAGTEEDLLERVRAGWPQRRPGQGRTGLDEVVIVPVDPAGFRSGTVLVDENTPLQAFFERRRPGEEGFVRVAADGPREEVAAAAVVLYAAPTLLANGGTRSGDFDWEVVALLAGERVPAPMDPLTMARNMLAEIGGTPCEYTAREFAEAVWYWSRRASPLR